MIYLREIEMIYRGCILPSGTNKLEMNYKRKNEKKKNGPIQGWRGSVILETRNNFKYELELLLLHA
jgi:hypothetical protein